MRISPLSSSLILLVCSSNYWLIAYRRGLLSQGSLYMNKSVKLLLKINFYKVKLSIYKRIQIIDMNNEAKQQISENDILQMLHKPKMSLIEQRFQQREKGLPIDEFVAVMLQHLDYDKKDESLKLKLTIALIDFFKEVDVNGDESMEWQEFSNHIIQLGLLRNDRSFKNVIKSYYPSDKVVDKQKHQTGVQSVYYFEKLKNLFAFEKDSSRFKVYSVNNAQLTYEVNAHKGSILDLQYLENQNLIATSSNDLTINFWDASSFTLKQIVSVPQIQLKIRYANWTSAQKQLLYTGGSDAIIHIYDASTLKEKGTISGWNPFYKSDQQQQGHGSPIGDILAIDSQQTLVTACLGGNICLWDINNHQLKKELRGHDKGIYSLDWCSWSQMNQCLLSAGLDHEASVWNTYVKDRIFLLRGHNHPLVGVKCLPQTPQIITSDIAGMVKVWDVRNFLCIQTFNVPVDELNSFCLTYSTLPGQSMKKRIIGAGKKMHYFQYDEPKDQFLTDQKTCIRVIFNLTLLCFITMHSDCIKIWDAKNGKLQSVYRGLSSPNAQLTSMILDSRQRKLFVGDSEGCIYTVNIKNGAKMKSFQKHNSLVTGLAYWSSNEADLGDDRYQDLRRIISISRDSQVFIHDEDSPQDAKSSCRYTMKQHQLGCNSVDIRRGSQHLASGSEDGSVIITNLISYRHEVLPRNCQNEIKFVKFLCPYDCLVTIDSTGNLVFYGVGQSKFKHKILFEKQYLTQSMTNNLQPFPVTAVVFEPESQILVLGDQFGNVQCWDLTEMLQMLQLTKISKNELSKRRESKKPHNVSQLSKILVEQTILLTQVRRLDDIDFSADLIKMHKKMKQIHNDGITCLQIVKENDAFITASFDCCCHIWSINDGRKLGSLLLGGDVNWKVKFDLQLRKNDSFNQAEQLLSRIQKKKTVFTNSSALQTQQEIKQFQLKKNGVLRNAKDLIEQQRKIFNMQQPIMDILGDMNDLEKQFFNQDDKDGQYNLMNQVSEFKSSFLDQMTNKKAKAKK